MNGNYLNKVLMIGAQHALYREDGKWYHNLQKFPGVLFDSNGYVLFQSEYDYKHHPQLQIKKDLHIPLGIGSLREYNKFNPFQKSLIEGAVLLSANFSVTEETIRTSRIVDVILRRKSLVDRLKKLYDNTCQLCGLNLFVGENQYYSEVHHIVPLGRPHNGVDKIDNMICVCPNCHVQLDLKVYELDTGSFKVIRHKINQDYIQYYNQQITIRAQQVSELSPTP